MGRTPQRQRYATVMLILGNAYFARVAGPLFIYVVRQYVGYKRLFEVYVKHSRLRIFKEHVVCSKPFHRVADALGMTPKLVIEIGDTLLYLFYTRRLLDTFGLEASQLDALKPLAVALRMEDVELVKEVAKTVAFRLRFWEHYKYLVRSRCTWEKKPPSDSLKLVLSLESSSALGKEELKNVKTLWNS